MQKRSDQGIEIYTHDTGEAGPHLVITGAVHGNEPCGPTAIRKLIGLIEGGEIMLQNGTLTVIPVCNPKAFGQDVRFVEYNLNRSMYPRTPEEIVYYEDTLRNTLCTVLEQADFLLDLHSCTAPSPPFVIPGGDIKHPPQIAYTRALGVPNILFGWADAVGTSDDVPDPRHTMGLGEYAQTHGAVTATVECGNHTHPQGAAFAFEAILNAMTYTGIADIPATLRDPALFEDVQKTIRFERVIFKTQEGSFAQDWNNLHPVAAGTHIGTFENGDEVTIPFDGYLIMPKENAALNAEWVYFGVEEELE